MRTPKHRRLNSSILLVVVVSIVALLTILSVSLFNGSWFAYLVQSVVTLFAINFTIYIGPAVREKRTLSIFEVLYYAEEGLKNLIQALGIIVFRDSLIRILLFVLLSCYFIEKGAAMWSTGHLEANLAISNRAALYQWVQIMITSITQISIACIVARIFFVSTKRTLQNHH